MKKKEKMKKKIALGEIKKKALLVARHLRLLLLMLLAAVVRTFFMYFPKGLVQRYTSLT